MTDQDEKFATDTNLLNRPLIRVWNTKEFLGALRTKMKEKKINLLFVQVTGGLHLM